MIDQETIRNSLDQALAGVELPFLESVGRGKVRDIYKHDGHLDPRHHRQALRL